MSGLTAKQVDRLLRPIRPQRVREAQGQSHVPAYDVAAHLTRIFGFAGWDKEILSKELLFETSSEGDRPKWTVGYSATVRLSVKNENGQVIAHWEDGACGDAVNQPSRADAHHLAMTTAISTAMKRCAAFGLGDQFGLSLYNKGSLESLIGMTLVMPEGAVEEVDLESHIPLPESLGNDEREVDEPEQAPEVVKRSAPVIHQDQGYRPVENEIPSDAEISAAFGEVEVVKASPSVPSDDATVKQTGYIRKLCSERSVEPHATSSAVVGRKISSMNELTKAEAKKIIDYLLAN